MRPTRKKPTQNTRGGYSEDAKSWLEITAALRV
jgi:hypothetical protein